MTLDRPALEVGHPDIETWEYWRAAERRTAKVSRCAGWRNASTGRVCSEQWLLRGRRRSHGCYSVGGMAVATATVGRTRFTQRQNT